MSKALILFIVIVSFACSKSNNQLQTARVSFAFNDLRSHKSNDSFKSISGLSALPTTFSDFNCYAVMATFPELQAINQCYDISSNPILRPDMMVGMAGFPSGVLGMDVKVGLNRKFTVIGWKWDGGGLCPPVFSDHQSFGTDLSEPYVLGEITGVNIAPSPVSQPIVINVQDRGSVANYTQVGECDGPMFNWGLNQFTGCIPNAIGAYGDVTSDWINCNADNYTMNPLMYNTNEITANDVFVLRTNSGNNAKIIITGVSGSSISFNYDVYAPGSETIIYTGTSVSINTAGPECVDLDMSSASPSSCVTDVSDLKIMDYASNYYFMPYSDSTSYVSARPALVSSVTPIGEVVKLRMLQPNSDNGNTYIQGGPFYDTDCIGFKVGALNQYNQLVPPTSNISVNMDYVAGGSSTVTYYTDSSCSSTLPGSLTIPAGQVASPLTYFKLSTPSDYGVLSATATGLLGGYHTYQLSI